MTDHLPNITLRRLSAVAALAAAFAAPTAAHAAKAPTVEVGIAQDAIALDGAEDLGKGAVRLHIAANDLEGARSVAVLELKRGVTRADVDAADLAGLDNAADAEKLGRLVAGATVSDENDYATTIVARAREHVVVDVSDEDGASAAFQVGKQSSGARVPRSDATIVLRDDGVTVPSALPRDGIVRVANRGELAHQVTVFRLKHDITEKQAIRAIRRGGRLDRIGTASTVSGLLSAGAVNRVELVLRAGRYLVASLHNPLTATGRPDVLRGLLDITRVR